MPGPSLAKGRPPSRFRVGFFGGGGGGGIAGCAKVKTGNAEPLVEDGLLLKAPI